MRRLSEDLTFYFCTLRFEQHCRPYQGFFDTVDSAASNVHSISCVQGKGLFHEGKAFLSLIILQMSTLLSTFVPIPSKILKSKSGRNAITGSWNKGVSCKREFFSKLIDTFLTSLFQFLADSTRDINDYLRVGRSLWPVFIRPIDPKNIKGTMKAISPKASFPPNTADSIIETRILAHLGQKLLRFTSTLSSEDPTGIMLDLSSHKKPCQQSELKLPYLQLCLLLAAFICQNNRTDQDKKFFASEGNGKRRKNSKAQQGEGENVAYSASTTEVKQLQSLRPRPFQLERVLSIFVTLVRLNPRDGGIFADMDEERIQSLGSTRLDMDLKQLVDLGFLHPASGRHANENLDRARFWCSLTRAEADRIATRASIPLDNYML